MGPIPVLIQFGFKQHFNGRHFRRVLLILDRFIFLSWIISGAVYIGGPNCVM